MPHSPTPQIPPDLITEQLDGQTMILSPHNGRVVVLSHTGSHIWQLLVAGKSIPEIEQHLVQTYVVTPQQARSDIQALLTQLKARELLA